MTDVAPPVSVPADKRLDGMLDACDLVLAFTKTSSHQEAVHILAGKILVVEINVHTTRCRGIRIHRKPSPEQDSRKAPISYP